MFPDQMSLGFCSNIQGFILPGVNTSGWDGAISLRGISPEAKTLQYGKYGHIWGGNTFVVATEMDNILKNVHQISDGSISPPIKYTSDILIFNLLNISTVI